MPRVSHYLPQTPSFGPLTRLPPQSRLCHPDKLRLQADIHLVVTFPLAEHTGQFRFDASLPIHKPTLLNLEDGSEMR